MNIDKRIVSPKAHYTIHSCNYTIFIEKEKRRWNTINIPTEKDVPEVKQRACFGDLLRLINSTPEANRLYYKVEDNSKDRLTPKQKEEWIRLNKRYKLLPPYISIKYACKNTYVFDFAGYSPSQFYTYFSTVRCIEEVPKFVKAILYLVDTHKMDFYTAYVLASRVCVDWSGHHIIDYTREYGLSFNNINEVKIPIKTIISLRRYAINMSTYDDRKISTNNHWNCQTTISNISTVTGSFTAEELSHELLKKAITSDVDEEAIDHIKEFELGTK